MKLLKKFSFLIIFGIGFADYSLRAMEEQESSDEEVDLNDLDLIKKAEKLDEISTKFGVEVHHAQLILDALDVFEEEAQNYQNNCALSLKELAARVLLSKPLNVEALTNKLPEELLEYIKQLIIRDQNLLPWVAKKAKSGSKKQKDAIIASCSPFFNHLNFSTNLLNLNEEEQNAAMIGVLTLRQIMLSILNHGTRKEINELIMLAKIFFNSLLNLIEETEEACFEDLLNFAQDDNIELFGSSDIRKKIIKLMIKGMINFVKNHNKNDVLVVAQNIEFRKFFDMKLDTIRNNLNFSIQAARRIPYILKNQNIDLHCKYKDMAALEWTELCKNEELTRLLKPIARKDKIIKFFDSLNLLVIDSVNLLVIAYFFSCVRFCKPSDIKPAHLVSLCVCMLFVYNFLM